MHKCDCVVHYAAARCECVCDDGGPLAQAPDVVLLHNPEFFLTELLTTITFSNVCKENSVHLLHKRIPRKT